MTYKEKLKALDGIKNTLIYMWKNEIDDRHKLAKQIMNVNLLISRARNKDYNTLKHIY